MRLPHRFYKFPFRFDVARLAQEVSLFPEEAWRRHPNDLKGNTFLPLVATRGDAFDDFRPPMRPTPWLEQSPYLRQVLGEFRTLIGRARLMRLEPECGVPLHFDSKQYWRDHTRVHVPLVTHPAIRFHCEDSSVHMAAGEAWTFDNWRSHEVVNTTQTRRIHLTMDTYGSNEFWELAKPLGEEAQTLRLIPFRPAARAQLVYETFVGDSVMSAAEVDLELSQLVADAAAHPGNDPAALEQLRAFTRNLRNEWRILWHVHGPEDLAHYASLASWARENAARLPPLKAASNGNPLMPALLDTLSVLVDAGAAPRSATPPAAATGEPRFDRPVFIVSAPRSGSTWLYEMLAQNDGLQTLGGEGHQHVESIEALQPARRDFDSNRLRASDATAAVALRLRHNYLMTTRDAHGRALRDQAPRPAQFRFLEKTPKNALRIPFLKAVFPDAKFIFLHRGAPANISAIMEAWRSGRFVTYPGLPGWQGLPWSLLLIPGWRELIGAPLAHIAMRQWRDTNETILDDLGALPAADWRAVRYEDLKEKPAEELHRLCDFADVPFGEAMRKATAEPGRLSRYTLTAPDENKWRKNQSEIESVLDGARPTTARLAAPAGEHGILSRLDS
ncbi:MAG TPA: sulfotransferase [Rhizomicrobium sp.]